MSFQSNDHRGGSPTFTIRVEKQPDGNYKATCPTQPSVPPGTGSTESRATEAFKQNLNTAVTANTLRNG